MNYWWLLQLILMCLFFLSAAAIVDVVLLPLASSCPVNTYPGANLLFFGPSSPASCLFSQCSALNALPSSMSILQWGLLKSLRVFPPAFVNTLLGFLTSGLLLTCVMLSSPIACMLCLIPGMSMRFCPYILVCLHFGLTSKSLSISNVALLGSFNFLAIA